MGGVVMTPFPDFSKADIDAILDWADNYQEPGAPTRRRTGSSRRTEI